MNQTLSHQHEVKHSQSESFEIEPTVFDSSFIELPGGSFLFIAPC